jgi:SAM-dependent methyltransferase
MDNLTINQIWSSAPAYESYIGRWSRLVAREFVQWLAVPAGKTWLDVGCGTGALTETIFETAAPRYVVGADQSKAYVEYLRRRLTDQRLCFDVSDVQDLNFNDEFYDNSVSGLCLNFAPDPLKGMTEMVRVTKPGGTVAAYVWDYAGEMQLMRHFWDAAVKLDPAARELDEGVRFAICKPEPLAGLARAAGLEDVVTRAIDIALVLRNFEDYWAPFLGGQGLAPNYVVSLSEERQDALRDRIRSMLPIAADGSISLVARAWAVRGTRVWRLH